MATVKLKINGQEVEVEKGTTILDAAKKIGVYIPTLCYHPFLPLEEACRICVVEDVRSGWSAQVAACVFPARNGMVIETDSDVIVQARKTILELLLSDHPNDCMTCQAAGECELQDLAYKYHARPTSYEGERHNLPVDAEQHPHLYVNMNKCVLCRRCIRACHDIEGADVLTKKGRGFHQEISTAFDLPWSESGCESCGHCADFCPVDAIGFRGGRDDLRSWEMKKESTVCLQCPAGCLAEYDTFEGKVVRVRGDFDSAASAGALCKVGRFNTDFINSPDRLDAAYVRNGGSDLAVSSVDDAVKTAAAALGKLRDSAGGTAIGVICGGMLSNEEYYLAQKLARAALATNNIDNVAGPWQAAIFEGLSSSLGFGAMTGSLVDIAKAGAVLVLGSNSIEKHAMAALKARKAARDGAVLIVAHPEQVPLTKTANMHLGIKAGSEGALLLGLMKTIVEEELYDKAYVEANTDDFDKLAKNLKALSMADIAAKTGLPEETLRSAARLYAGKRPASLVYGVDPGSSPESEAFYQLCSSLQLLLGSVGVPGGGVNVMGCAGNAQGAADFGALPKYLPGYNAVGDAAAGKVLGKIWKSEPPKKAGLSWPEMFTAIEKGQMKALYLVGVDPFDLGLPTEKVESALGKLQLLVVQNLAKSKAMDYAHVVLPSASFLEKEGTATSCERRLQRLAKVLSSPGQAKADYDLLSAMLAALKPELKANGIASVFDEAKVLFKELEGVNSSAIPVEGIQWPVASENGSGAERLGLPGEGKPKFKFMSKSLKDLMK